MALLLHRDIASRAEDHATSNVGPRSDTNLATILAAVLFAVLVMMLLTHAALNLRAFVNRQAQLMSHYQTVASYWETVAQGRASADAGASTSASQNLPVNGYEGAVDSEKAPSGVKDEGSSHHQEEEGSAQQKAAQNLPWDKAQGPVTLQTPEGLSSSGCCVSDDGASGHGQSEDVHLHPEERPSNNLETEVERAV
ncbi:hypothetical protein MFIFM68171_08868 [Madurella fahalii]|uniref:Uncharacterized protein n=1 Tax=Madurella fahalii TaxID=1157608 RepID=A0ABQ0GLL2_9PEZI